MRPRGFRPGMRAAPSLAVRAAAWVVAWTLAPVPSAPAAAQTLADAREALRTGEYADAIRDYTRLLRRDDSSVEARRGLVDALLTVGRYAEAAERARAGGVELAGRLGRALASVGRLAEAEASYRRAVEGGASDRVTAGVDLAELLFRTGRVDEATARFDAFIDVYNDADGHLTAPQLVAVGRAVAYLGRTDPDLFQDALKAFDEAAALDPGDPEPRVRAGMLFLDRYAAPDAHASFQEVLDRNPRHPEALLGEAQTLDFDGTAGARRTAAEVLEVNANHAQARAFLADVHLALGNWGDARVEAQRALEINPSSLEALSALAAASFLTGDMEGFRRTRRRALDINPRYAGLDATVADLAAQNRRYADASARAEAAVALDSTAWDAWGLAGMNLLRLGRIDEGRRFMEVAFAGDPYNPWFKNTLDLLDTFQRYRVRETEHFELVLRGDEAELLGPYVEAVAEEAYDSLARRYGVEPPLPVRVELFPSHADFSVRTLGEAGLGALGVSFGSVLVMDSPAARGRGEYNWASVLWHELAHAFHLGMTEHRVPRWFSEGLAVHEQRKARPHWGHQPGIAFLKALRDGRLKPVSRLNDGFMRPEYPEQVVFSYLESSLVFDLIEEEHGFGAIRSMLEGYRRGRTTAQLFEEVLGTDLEGFDRTFERHMKEKFSSPLAGLATVGDPPDPREGLAALEAYVRSHPGDLVARLRLGGALARKGRFEEARPHLEAALRIFPEYGGPDSPYLHLAHLHESRGDLERAAASLARLNALSESNYDALTEEADLLETLGRRNEAARVLAQAIQVYPYDIDAHQRLAELLAEGRRLDEAVRERAAVLALGPVDRAEALYLLARARAEAGDAAGARRTVLQALELAPSYEAALELLLQLRGGREGEEGR